MNYSFVLIIISVICLIVIVFLCCFKYISRKRPLNPDDLEGLEFEDYCAGLLEANGFTDITVTQGSCDYGVDILATKEMITYAIQCKVYSTPVGIKAIQEAYTGRDYYDRMIGVVLTNQYFTKPAIEAANKLKILMWDRDYLNKLIENSDF